MSVFLKPGEVKVRDENGNYKGINILAETSTQECLDAIEEKGEQTKASIPDNYTALSEEVNSLNERMDNLKSGLSDEAKVALLACFTNAAWINEHGQDYYDALYDALYNDGYPKLTVEYDDRGHIVLISDNIDSLKEYITVKYFENSSSTGTVIPAAQYTLYTLSGTLSSGLNIIHVTYSSASSSFAVNAVGIVVPETYERKDYIKVVDSYDASSSKPSGAVLRINVGGNLNQLSYYADFYLEDFWRQLQAVAIVCLVEEVLLGTLLLWRYTIIRVLEIWDAMYMVLIPQYLLIRSRSLQLVV